MSDLFTPPMPLAVRDKLILARLDLLKIAEDIDAALKAFFDDAWTACHTTFTYQHGEKTITNYHTPDFNRFDAIVGRYEKATNKMRWMLWDDINAGAEASRPGVEPETFEGEPKEAWRTVLDEQDEARYPEHFCGRPLAGHEPHIYPIPDGAGGKRFCPGGTDDNGVITE